MASLIKFKKFIIVKENQNVGTLIFHTEEDKVYRFTGDASLAILIIYRHSKNSDGIEILEIIDELNKISENFTKNLNKQKSITDLVDHLRNLNLID
jgi:hypothetical protein